MRRNQSLLLVPRISAWCPLHMAMTYLSICGFPCSSCIPLFQNIKKTDLLCNSYKLLTQSEKGVWGGGSQEQSWCAGDSWFAPGEFLASAVGSTAGKAGRVGLDRMGVQRVLSTISAECGDSDLIHSSQVWVCTKPGKLVWLALDTC